MQTLCELCFYLQDKKSIGMNKTVALVRAGFSGKVNYYQVFSNIMLTLLQIKEDIE